MVHIEPPCPNPKLSTFRCVQRFARIFLLAFFFQNLKEKKTVDPSLSRYILSGLPIVMVAKVAVLALAGISGAAAVIKLPLEKRNPITIQKRLEMERSLTVGYNAQGAPTSIVINDYQ